MTACLRLSKGDQGGFAQNFCFGDFNSLPADDPECLHLVRFL